MYAYPTTTSAYRLTAGRAHYTTRRSGPVLGIVLHVTAGLQDTDMAGVDGSAEGTAKWAVSSGAEVSWHVGVDSDSIVPCLPDTYTGWHAKGYNSRTFGIEISNRDAVWGNKPANWVEATLRNAAKACAPIVKKYGLPLELNSRATVDSRTAAGKPFGFTYHSRLSDIRTDPGKDFPWARFLTLVRAELAPTSPEEDDDMPTVHEVWTTDLTKTGTIGGAASDESPLEILTRVARNVEMTAGLVKALGNAGDVAAAVVAALPSGVDIDEAELTRAFVAALTELATPKETQP